MLVNKLPLHISINNNMNMNMGMNTDNMSVDSNYDHNNNNNEENDDDVVMMMMEDLTPVSTPVDQMTYKDYNFPEAPRCGRTASVSSIASSISNVSTHNDFSYSSFASHYKLSENFETVLMQTYQDYQTNPTITPFNESNPPSGILAKVSKDALNTAMTKGIDIGIEVNNYSLTIIRQKLIQLCRSSSISSQSSSSMPQLASRTNSIGSLTTYPSLNLSSRFNSVSNPPTSGLQNQVSFELRTPTEGYFSFEAPPTPPQPQQQYHYQTQNQYQYQQPQQLQQLQPPQQLHSHSQQPQQQSSLQPSFLQDPVSIQSQHQHQQQSQPQTSTTHPNSGVTLDIPDGLFNATSNRKRESLRLKRSGNKPTYN